MKKQFIILGSGMAGLGAAHFLRLKSLQSVIFEKKPYAGGHTSTHIRDGYVFDEGPHVSFTKNEELKEIFAAAVNENYQSIDAYIDNYWQGQHIRHPVITNMHGLPHDVIVRCLRDYIEIRQRPAPEIANYEDWLVASYGRAYAELFPMRYTKKYHTTPAKNLTTEWVGPRLYQATLDEVLLGALAKSTPNIHYVQRYRYPTHGGFAAFLSGLIAKSEIYLNHNVEAIDANKRELRFSDGRSVGYDTLISSLPLPDLVSMTKDAPKDVVEASQLLACTSVVLVNLGVDRPKLSRASWTYYYDDELPFSRVSFPNNFSPFVAPEGCSSIQAEVYFSRKYKPLKEAPEKCIDPVIDGLRKCGALRMEDKIVFRSALHIPYANIIFDLDRPAALEKVHGYLDDIGIAYCGRYGDWGYLWSDEAFESGKRAAERALALA